jgi:hypothetical protein
LCSLFYGILSIYSRPLYFHFYKRCPLPGVITYFVILLSLTVFIFIHFTLWKTNLFVLIIAILRLQLIVICRNKYVAFCESHCDFSIIAQLFVNNCLSYVINPLKPKQVKIIFKNSVRTAKKAQLFTITKINWLTLFKEIIAVYSEKHTKYTNSVCTIHSY